MRDRKTKYSLQVPERIPRGAYDYPEGLERLGDAAPESLSLLGNRTLLHGSPVALFCSVLVPPGVVLQALDLARQLAGATQAVVSGFQSPLEREFLRMLLQGTVPVVICPARGIDRFRIPAPWRGPLEEGRVLLASPFSPADRRPTVAAAELRNRFAAALSSRVLVLHASSGGRLARLAAAALAWGLPVECLDDPSNEDVRVMGARPIAAAGRFPD